VGREAEEELGGEEAREGGETRRGREPGEPVCEARAGERRADEGGGGRREGGDEASGEVHIEDLRSCRVVNFIFTDLILCFNLCGRG
jgi:hypothetical protein